MAHTIEDQQFLQAYESVMKAERILLIAHQKPDGDTSGSALALQAWIESLGKSVSVFCLHELANQYHFLPGAFSITTDPSLFQEQWDLYITCDSGDLTYAGVDKFIDKNDTTPVINFDHHTSNNNFGTINLVDETASSTAEVIYRFFQANDIELNRDMSICLLTGVFTDTGGFSNAATNQSALQMAAEFTKKGASLRDIHRATIANKSIEVMKLWGKIMSRLHMTEKGIAYTYILREDLVDSGLSSDDIDGLSNYLSQINDARAIFVFSEREGGKIKVSMRTFQNDIDLAKLASAVGGGGHKKAAGFTLSGRFHVYQDQVQILPA